MTEDEMAGWYHRLDGHEFEYTPGVGDGQWGLVCCNSWGCKELDMTERLNWTELNTYFSSSNQHLFSVALMVRTFKTYSLRNFQVHNTVLLTIVTMLYIKSPELNHLITECFYDLTNIFPLLPPYSLCQLSFYSLLLWTQFSRIHK